MKHKIIIKKAIEKTIVPLVCLPLVVVLCISLLHNRHKQDILRDDLKQLRITADILVGRKERLSQHVALLKSDYLDEDYLEERVRESLGLAHPDEIIIYSK